jgi:hypothetical protein
MSQPFKRNYLQHALALSHWMATHGAEGGIDPFSQALNIRLKKRTVRFFPQFVVEDRHGNPRFTPQLRSGVAGFVGWLPYFNKVWPIAQDKLAFKEHVQREGLRTPDWSTDPSHMRGPFLVKQRCSSFGLGLRGPFKSTERVALSDREYCEQFIVGQLLKAWYWDDQIAVVELVDMPTVHGDGLRTLRQLITAKLASTDPWPHDLEPLATLQGLTLDAVVPARQRVLSDYRYLSVLNPASRVDHNVRSKIQGTSIEAQLVEAGACCWRGIPEAHRAGTAFSLDGIVDPQGRVWFLEANCNPQLHPAFYDVMLQETFLQ